MDAKVTVEFIIENTGEHKECEFETYNELVRFLIREEGLWGIINDDYKIIKVEALSDIQTT